MQLLEQISITYAWYQAYGNRVEDLALATYVHNVDHPHVWMANHVSCVRARSSVEIDQVLGHADEVLAHCSHRFVIVDPLTPEPFVARLALASYRELGPTIQMALVGPFAARGAEVQLHPVTTDDDWRALYTLVRTDHLEARRTHGEVHGEHITRGLVAGYRAKSGASQFFLATIDGVACAYGSAVVGPYGMGIVEDLFTLPAYRRRGIATALIRHAVAHARDRGMATMLIGALAEETAKSLYVSLGFVPQCLTRHYLLDAPSG
jgi:GNAT superfamily N-acetyltransferase